MVARRTFDLLPQVFQTKTNKRFLNATMDQLVQEPVMTRMASYVGRQETSSTYKVGDPYLQEGDPYSQFYQLEPSLVVRRPNLDVADEYKVDNVYNYLDFLNEITSKGGIVDDHNRLFTQEYYNYQGFVDIEKMVNYGQYYWIPSGPDTIDVYAGGVEMSKAFSVGVEGNKLSTEGYTEQVLGEYGHKIGGFNELNPTITLVRGGVYTFDLAQPGFPFNIQTEIGDLEDATDSVSYQENISKREVFGVTNNGTDFGTVTFVVPKKTAQDRFVEMTEIDPVDMILDVPFNSIYNVKRDTFYTNYSLDGIRSGDLVKKVVFTDTSDDNWIVNDGSTLTTIPQSKRKGIWTLTVDANDRYQLAYTSDWEPNSKTFVRQGRTYGYRYVYKDATLTIRIMPNITAPLDELYYQSPQYGYGVIKLIEQDEDAIINVNDIIGKKNYTSPNGITFTTGLKVRFTNNVTPAAYKDVDYIVEGVGKAITLHKWVDFVTPETYTVNVGSGFDATGEEYDTTNYDNTSNSPTNKEYITINRASLDGNPWTRGNRWFHKDVLNYAASVLTPEIGYPFIETQRAKRPIIEFLPNMKLHNGADSYIGSVDAVDLITTDALSTINGAADAYVDSIQLNTGVKVIFSKDSDPTNRATIWRVTKINVDGLEDIQINLERVTTATHGASVSVISGVDTQGLWYYWDGDLGEWVTAQQKLEIGQAPLFDIYGYNPDLQQYVNFGNKTVFPSSTFTGCKLLSYKINSMATPDNELNFGLTYKNIGNLGDILFENNYDTDTFIFNYNSTDIETKINTGNPMTITATGTPQPLNAWSKINLSSNQYIENSIIATLNKRNDFVIDAKFYSNYYEKNVFVTLNGTLTTAYKLYLDSVKNQTILRFDSDLAVNDKIIVQMYGKPNQRKNFYTIPKNLERNSFNDNFTEITLGQMRDHLIEITKNSLQFVGEPAGNNNLRDIDYIGISGKILQHSAPMHFAQMLVNNPSTDVIAAIDYSRREYSRFKDKILTLLETTEFKDISDPRAIVDRLMEDIAENADSNLPFYYTDMLPYGKDRIKTSYTVFDPTDKTYNAVYPYRFNYDFGIKASDYRNLLVYYTAHNGLAYQQLLVGRDYTVDGRVVTMLIDLNADDVIDLYEFTSTKGCMIPATPTSLGLWPKFTPEIYTDDTLLDPVDVIQGHDGSKMLAFNDFRDQVLLEFESRIYNNVRTDWFFTEPYHQKVEPTAFRETSYSFDEWTQLLSSSFLEWAGYNGLDVFENTATTNDPFSWNYAEATDKLYGELLPGSWRAIYKYFFETDRPHTHPWELGGYFEKPVWWDQKYGVAPYTAGNTVMWQDLEDGVYWEDLNGDGIYDDRAIDSLYVRPGLTSILPVDDHGNLLPPRACVIKAWDAKTTSKKWRFGDQGPVETAWRRSSEYPFAMMKAYALARPAEFCTLSFNLRDYRRNQNLDQIVNERYNDRKIRSSDISDSNYVVPGINVWIRDRITALGQDVQSNLIDVLADCRLNLAYKMAGFTDKKYLQVLAEQSSPASRNTGVLIPEENYNVVLTKSSPVSRDTYSAIILEKSDAGWYINGFDKERPYFSVIPSKINNNNYTITVGNSSAIVYQDGETNILTIPYGTELTSKQQVADFLICYGRYLTTVGFVFDELLADNTTAKDWSLAVKEFLFWAQQGWDNQTVISLTPAESTIKFDNGVAVVDDLSNTFNGTRILDSDSKIVPSDGYRVYRDGTSFEINLRDRAKGIHLIDLTTVQYEHTLVFDNKTVFNDVIFQQELGNRQQRLKIVGKKTSNWNGSLYAPGFLINHKPVPTWVANTDYYKGDIIKLKNKYFTAKNFLPGSSRFDQNNWIEIEGGILEHKLIPNPAFNAQQFEGFYDVDSEDVNVSADLQARHSTGFQKRSYFTDIGLDTISQHKFYLGMIAEKGTNAVINKFLRAKLPYIENNLTIKEEWAIKNSEYGNTENHNLIEIPLGNLDIYNNAVVLELLDKNDARDRRWNTFKTKDLTYIPNNYTKDIFTKTATVNSIIDKAGPVYFNEVAATVFDVNKFENVSSLAPVMGEGSLIWVASDIDADWNIYRACNDTGLYAIQVGRPSNLELEFVTARAHGIQLRDKILIKSAYIVTKSDQGATTTVDMSGVYRVVAVSEKRIRVQLPDINATVVAGSLRAPIYKLKPVRYTARTDFAVDTPYRGWKTGDKVWIDDVDGKWQVLENQANWKYVEALSPVSVGPNDDFGQQMAMTSNQRNLIVSSAKDSGTLYVYGIDDYNTWAEQQSVIPYNASTAEMGYSLDVNDDGLIFAGAPGTDGEVGAVYVFSLNVGITDFYQIIYDTYYTLGDRFGHSVAASKDGRWLYISSTVVGAVDAYQLVEVETKTRSHTGDGATNTFLMNVDIQSLGLLEEQIKVFVGGVLQIPYVDYTLSDTDANLSNDTVVMTTAPEDGIAIIIEYSNYYEYVDTISNPSASDFGYKVDTSTDGSQVVISAPTESYTFDGKSYTNSGAVYVYDRSIEKFISDGITTTYSTTYAPTSRSVVTIDGIATTAWSIVAGDVVLDDPADISAIIAVETNQFVLTERIISADPQDDMNYGHDVIICPNNCSVYVGAPKYVGTITDPGAVYRHINTSKIYGSITGTTVDPTVTPGSAIRINGFSVTFTGGDLQSAIDDINSAGIPGLSAEDVDGKIRITTDSTLTFNKLTLVNDNYDALGDLGLELFPSVQRIDTIYQEDGASFGQKLSISPDATRLMISTTKASSYSDTTFDGDATSFDAQSLRYRDKLPHSGAVYLYEYQRSANETDSDVGKFAFATKFVTGNVKASDAFGRSATISNNWVMITSPKGTENGADKGLLYVFNNAQNLAVWNTLREQGTDLDSRKLTRAYIYNDNTKDVVAELPVIDHSASKFLPDVIKDVKFTTNYDPAIYNHVPSINSFSYDQRTAWGPEHVGELWWDTNAAKYVEWQQGSLLNRVNMKDMLFPSSSIDVYEWTESDMPPTQYNKVYIPLGKSSLYTVNEVYTQKIDYNNINSQPKVKYYFWTKVITSTAQPDNNLTAITQGLLNPKLTGIPYISVIASNAVALFNSTDMIGNDYILRMEYKKDNNPLPVHTEWSLFDDGTRLGISQAVFNKILDSVAGIDSQGRAVPDPTLTEKQRYGLSIYPRQTMLKDNSFARAGFVDFSNDHFATYPITLVRNLNEFKHKEAEPTLDQFNESVQNEIELSYLDPNLYLGKIVLVKEDSLVSGWTLRRRNASVLWRANTVYLKDVIVNRNDVNYIVTEKFTSGTEFDTTYLTRLPASYRLANDEWTVIKSQSWNNTLYWTLVDWYSDQYDETVVPTYTIDYAYEINDLNIKNNDVIKIKNSSAGGFQIVRVKDTTLELVGQENATVAFLPSVYSTSEGGFGIEDRSFDSTGFSVDNNKEVRNLFQATVNMLVKNAGVFVDEFRSEYRRLMENTIFLINTQFKDIDWLFRTSFVSIIHQIRKLDQIPVYVRQPETLVQDYINEVKPYHSKLRKYLSSYPGSDTAGMYSTDFDLPPILYPDGKYKSPNYYDSNDASAFASYPWKSWADNHGYEVEAIDIVDGGVGYTNDTVLTFVSETGSGASARVKVKAGGVISQVILLKRGSGYMADQSGPPTIVVQGLGTGAVLVPRMRNLQIRHIKNNIVFDRITYSNSITDWYSGSTDTLFLYNNTLYRVPTSVTPGATELDLLSVVEYSGRRWSPRTRYRTNEVIWENFNDQSIVWQPYTTYLLNDIISHNDDVYVVTNDFTSGSTFNSTYLDPYPYKNMFWEVTEDFTSGGLFDDKYLTPYYGKILDNASDRIWSYYGAPVGEPGKVLSQLMKGIEYPGVFVKGPSFDQNPGYDTTNYDLEQYDAYDISEEGIPVVASIDTNYVSTFLDTNLGLRPEDIITDGAGFVDTYNSHAPEELVPGIIFDTLDIKVVTAPGNDLLGDGAGPDVLMTALAVNEDTRFAFNDLVNGGVEKLIVWSKIEGFKIEGVDFTVDWKNKEIVFPLAFPDPTDIVYILALGETGENILEPIDYLGDGSRTAFSLRDVRKSAAQQIYVKVNGTQVSNYTVSFDPSIPLWTANTQYQIGDLVYYPATGTSKVYQVLTDFVSGGTFSITQTDGGSTYSVLSEYDYIPQVIFNTAPAVDSFIQINTFNQSSLRKAYSSIKETTYTITDASPTYPSGYVFNLPETMQYIKPWNTYITVRLNKEELAPANNTYYTGDGVTTNWDFPLIGNLTPDTIADNDMTIVVDNVVKTQGLDYSVYRDGSSNPVIQFFTAPAAGSKIIFSDGSVADYSVITDTQVRIKEKLSINNGANTDLKAGDRVTIVMYSNHDMYDMRTQVFKGVTYTTVTTGGFDSFGFDPTSGFDTVSNASLSNTTFELSRPVGNVDYLQVFVNGRILIPVYNFKMLDSTRFKIDSAFGLKSTDVVFARHFSENTRKPTLKFRYFKDMNSEIGTMYGISYTGVTKLAQELNITDDTIYLEDTSVLSDPSIDTNTPGVVYIRGERITYWIKDNATNTLSQIRRSTSGTGARMFYSAGEEVVDCSNGLRIPNGDKLFYELDPAGQYFYGPQFDNSTLVVKTLGLSLQDTNTTQAEFLKAICR